MAVAGYGPGILVAIVAKALFCAWVVAQAAAFTKAPLCWSTFETQDTRFPDYHGT